MARGWESKSIEDAQLEAEARRVERRRPPDDSTPEERQQQVEIDSLQLTRTRLIRDIAATANDRYREQLTAGLRHVEEKLRALGWQEPA